MSKFIHNCDACQFLGEGVYQKRPVDWYACGLANHAQVRTLVARYDNGDSQYASATIGETAEPSPLVMAALAQGLELTQAEKDKLLKSMLVRFRESQGVRFWRDCTDPCDNHKQIGQADWLGIA